ncbi:MAG: hypothetical protein M3017_17280 [Actinomycetota bacterium]|nr:hypothetical protein [Actinomycetota bacterium]
MMLLDSDALLDFLTGQNDERQSEWFKLHPERPHTTALAVAEVLHAVESMLVTNRPEDYDGLGIATVSL